MSSLTQLEFLEHLDQDPISSDFLDDEDNDTGLIMKMDSIPKCCGNVDLRSLPGNSIQTNTLPILGLGLAVLPTSSILQIIPDVLLKKMYQVTDVIEKKGKYLLPWLLYLSLLGLGFQAIGVFLLLASSLSYCFELWFLISCSGTLAGIYMTTSLWGIGQIPSPPPTPSHSSASLSTLTFTLNS